MTETTDLTQEKMKCRYYREKDRNCLKYTYPGELDPCTDADVIYCKHNYPHQFQDDRFSIRESDYAIVDSKGVLAPVMVNMDFNDDGSENPYADRSSVLNFLNRQQLLIRAKSNHIDKMVYLLRLEIENAESDEVREALKRVARMRL